MLDLFNRMLDRATWLKIANEAFENVSKCKYFGTTLTE
jgi:hypothetical protein